MEKIYDCDYFIDKFSAIPYALWRTGGWGYIDDIHCAGGHCGMNKSMTITPEFKALNELFNRLDLNRSAESYNSAWGVTRVNDGETVEYQQATPRERILAALRDIKKLTIERNPEPSVATVDAQRTGSWPNKQSSLTNLIPIVDEVVDVKNVKQNV